MDFLPTQTFPLSLLSRDAPFPEATPTTIPQAEEEEKYSSLALCLVLVLLIGSFFTSYYLKIKKITAVHETIVGLFAGMIVGLALRLGPGDQVQRMLSFSNNIMLNVLLPPIILASGYDLRQENFFRNFGVILTFAFAGTFISAVVIGIITYLWSLLHLESISLSFLECLIFGSTLSATDPVTILAIFNTYKVDPQLYSVIFGESILNDAVSIVMFDTLTKFRGQEIYISSLFQGVALFLFIFSFSMLLGVVFGLGCSLMLKHSKLSQYPALESCLVMLIAYTSYFFSNGITLSGIVSLLFCGITLKHYAYHNMSLRTQRTTRYIFQTLANLSENFIFIYLGLSLFTQAELRYKPLFIIVSVLSVVASRYCAVFPIAGLVNTIRRARNRRRSASRGSSGGPIPDSQFSEELPREYQIMLFWAGLRGAVGFALSAGIEGQNAIALQTTVLVTVVLTVVVFGGTTAQMLKILGIKTGVQDDEGDSSDEDEDTTLMRLRQVKRRNQYGNGRSSRTGGSGSNSRRNRDRAGNGNKWNEDNVPLTYLDEEDDEDLQPISRSNTPSGSNKRRTTNQFSIADLEDLDETSRRSSESSEALPSSSKNNNNSTSSTPTSSKPSFSANDFEAAKGGSASAMQLLDKAGLIIRDGQWFQKIDERYLLPMFSNSVASRKHEARKVARKEGINANLNEEGEEEGGEGVGSSRTGLQSEGIKDDSNWDEVEKDAEIADDDGDESEDFFNLNQGGASGSKRRTPTGSRRASDDRPNLSGAFAP